MGVWGLRILSSVSEPAPLFLYVFCAKKKLGVFLGEGGLGGWVVWTSGWVLQLLDPPSPTATLFHNERSGTGQNDQNRPIPDPSPPVKGKMPIQSLPFLRPKMRLQTTKSVQNGTWSPFWTFWAHPEPFLDLLAYRCGKVPPTRGSSPTLGPFWTLVGPLRVVRFPLFDV